MSLKVYRGILADMNITDEQFILGSYNALEPKIPGLSMDQLEAILALMYAGYVLA